MNSYAHMLCFPPIIFTNLMYYPSLWGRPNFHLILYFVILCWVYHYLYYVYDSISSLISQGLIFGTSFKFNSSKEILSFFIQV